MSEITIGGHKVTAQADYSTSETFTGRYWIDGKKIYRKVVDQTITTYTDSSNRRTFTLQDSSVSYDKIICINGCYYPNGGVSDGTIPLSWGSADIDGSRLINNANRSYILQNVLNVQVYFNVAQGQTSIHFYLVLEYTKTTD